MKYHGNYCGPNWSAGKRQSSVVSDVPAVDEFDELCKTHDAVYASQPSSYDLQQADLRFAYDSLFGGTGLVAIPAGLGVGIQGVVRGLVPRSNQRLRGLKMKPLKAPPSKQQLIDDYIEIEVDPVLRMAKKKPAKNLRGKKNGKSSNHRQKAKQPQIGGASVSPILPPSAVGSIVTAVPSIRRVSKDGEHSVMQGTAFMGSLGAFLTQSAAWGDYQIAAVIPMHPLFFGSNEITVEATLYQEYRFRKFVIKYIPSASTSQAGRVVLSHQLDPLAPIPARGETNATVPSAAMSRTGSKMSNAWAFSAVSVPCNNEWKNIVNHYGHTMDELISGLGMVYTTTGAVDIGEIVVDYEIEFKARGKWQGEHGDYSYANEVTCAFAAAGSTVDITAVTGLSPGDEQIVCMYIDVGSSTFGGGVTLPANFFNTAHNEILHPGKGVPLFYCQTADGTGSRWYHTLADAMARINPLKHEYTSTTNTILRGSAYDIITDLPEISG